MSLLEVLQLVGYGTGASMTLWMSALLVRRRHLRGVEKSLIALGITIGIWHSCNFLTSLHRFLGLATTRWDFALRSIDSLAVISITLAYSILLHVHLHLWADARNRELTSTERLRVYLSYLPAVFLPVALIQLWRGPYEAMLTRFAVATVPVLTNISFLLAFSLWATYVLCLIAATDLLMARLASTRSERRFLVVLAGSFIVVAALVFLHGAVGVGSGGNISEYLKTLANLGSLLPAALIVYYIYRYRYLELVIRDSLVLASFSVVILTLYLVLVRSLGMWLTARFELRGGAVESLLILGLALVAVPIKGWLDRRFHRMFQQEATLYREVIARISDYKGQYQHLHDLLEFIEAKATDNLGLRRLRIIAPEMVKREAEQGKMSTVVDVEALTTLITEFEAAGTTVVEGNKTLSDQGFDLAFLLKRERRVIGLMLVAAAEDVLTPDTRTVLEVLAGQLAVAIEDSLIVEHNVRLERQLAQGERLAVLGQMAATVAHEVKNPLSAIKSIAQVMREDTVVANEYGRDLDLIVGETDRLNQSVSQLLNFAKSPQTFGSELSTEIVVRTVIEICRTEARGRNVEITSTVAVSALLNATVSQPVKDALTNLALNAVYATPVGGTVAIEVAWCGDQIVFSVEDSGPGVPEALRDRIWEPFFTTKQRGTGLGLSIVRKRMEEAGGEAVLTTSERLGGARFELRISSERCVEVQEVENRA
jgi:signal transduction histidine kinase